MSIGRVVVAWALARRAGEWLALAVTPLVVNLGVLVLGVRSRGGAAYGCGWLAAGWPGGGHFCVAGRDCVRLSACRGVRFRAVHLDADARGNGQRVAAHAGVRPGGALDARRSRLALLRGKPALGAGCLVGPSRCAEPPARTARGGGPAIQRAGGDRCDGARDGGRTQAIPPAAVALACRAEASVIPGAASWQAISVALALTAATIVASAPRSTRRRPVDANMSELLQKLLRTGSHVLG